MGAKIQKPTTMSKAKYFAAGPPVLVSSVFGGGGDQGLIRNQTLASAQGTTTITVAGDNGGKMEV